MSDNDTLQRFIFEHAPIRGELVHLDATWQAILERHDYPPMVRNFLGEMMAAAALLSATLKLEGRMVIQLQGNGPINLMMVEVADNHDLRGLAHWQDLPEHSTLSELVGDGRLTITLEPKEAKDRYQSIVAITGDTLAEALQEYLQNSEQLDTHLWLTADNQRAAGMLLQRLPGKQTEEDKETWNRALHLAATLTSEELLQLPKMQTIKRLFHEEDIRVFEPFPLCFRCSCSRDRVVNMLRTLGYDEVQSILEEKGKVFVACEFCNQKYEFDSVDVEQLFASEVTTGASKTRH